jgi:hypothetical protein
MCRNCLLKHVVEGKTEGRIEVTARRGRPCKHLLNDFKEARGHYKLKEEALDRTLRRIGFGRGCGPVVRQTTYWMNGWMDVRHSSLWCQYFIHLRSVFSYKIAFMNGEFGSLWKGLWLFLGTPLQFYGGSCGDLELYDSWYPGRDSKPDTASNLERVTCACPWVSYSERRVWITSNLTKLHYYVLPV